ncbi:LysR family transcriptional regulator [Pelagovum pacificum]|uniref:LysR family transcriptional regulator n=1 Tax=Pelagovum pacificum TaxID=2588711 RepID=A0A5C5GH54_9RHOB|nr:LysR family transcriptional regulator [Pelagovum pacificum]QQA42753.1 LysR family transcriptional regulator [Pelagovum pacificum]TNY34098.1 LysR family transcriptional regulator [Pelagovum pacificum]
MDWRDIPSLSALRAFEAAARLGSFSGAARELNVTHAAIAQHVRSLEDHFGVQLMTRQGKAMAVTVEGQGLSRALTEAFALVESATRDLLGQGANRALRVALTPSFAANWLMPRIGRFWVEHPEVALELIPSNDLVDLRADGMDLAIRYGRGGWPGVDIEQLVPAGHVAVGATAKYSDRIGSSFAELSGETWIVDYMGREEELWAAESGIDFEKEKVRAFDTAELAREAAKAGIGVALLPLPIVVEEVVAGRLVILTRQIDSDVSYSILTRPGTVSPARDIFIRWLRSEAKKG